jgi:hypothetical protein
MGGCDDSVDLYSVMSKDRGPLPPILKKYQGIVVRLSCQSANKAVQVSGETRVIVIAYSCVDAYAHRRLRKLSFRRIMLTIPAP